MECRDAQFYLRLRRPGTDELGPELTADLERHLAACPRCAAEARAAAAFDNALATAMQSVPVPVGLREKLVANLSAVRGTSLRRRAYRGFAVAASLLLAFGIGFGAFSASRPRLDVESLALATDFELQNQEEATRLWLKENKLPDGLPEPFDYDLLVTRCREEVQGREVPVVAFRARQGPGFAKVYVFRKNHAFDLKDVKDRTVSDHSNCRALVIDDQARFPGAVYVIVHTGQNLDPFLRAAATQPA